VALYDEGDLVDNKTNRTVLTKLHHVPVRVALSGTLDASKLKKDLPHNFNVEQFFGGMRHQVTNRELIDAGISSEVKVKIIEGNTTYIGDNYPDEVKYGLVRNKKRNRKIIKRIKYHISKGRTKQLIILQRHKHIEKVFKLLQKQDLPYIIDWVHHSRKDRIKVSQDFMDGKIDILIGSMILKRGKNFKQMQYMLNAGGGKSPENTLQLLGRAFRGCEYFEDFWDQGLYLKKHSRKRVIYYKNEKLQVINKYK
jgi:superfamily II DNA or RNA helicase